MSRAKSLFGVRGLLLMLLPAVVIAVTVLATARIERSAEQRGFNRVQNSQQLLTAWLNQSNGLRVFLQTGNPAALATFDRLVEPFEAAVQVERTDARGVPGAAAALASAIQSARRWQSWGRVAVTQIRQHGVRPLPLAIAEPRSSAAAAFQMASEHLTAVMEQQRKSDIADAADLSGGIVLLAFVILAIMALAVARVRHNRDARAVADERAYVEERRRLSQVMLAAETPQEVCRLVKGAVESRVRDSSVVVLQCDNQTNQMELLTLVPEASPLAISLMDVEPRACLAIRLGTAQTSDPTEVSTVRCELCGHGGYAICEPLLAGGDVTGSMLITHPAPLRGPERRAIDDSVAYITPVLANLRSLQLAQNRAQTDPLTELPNRRALDAVLKRMVAQASRTATPLSLLLIDVDRFKDVNDTFGHDCGDELLVTVAGALARSVRASDFVARLGGDEFVVALPATDLEGASIVADKLRNGASNARVLGFSWEITASIGVATYPKHGTTVEAVMRAADTALYQAKKDGRNCVRHAPVNPASPTALITT